MLTDCCFEGFEAEGPDAGAKTFFIANHKEDPEKIYRYVTTSPEITHVYFGAGKKYGVSELHVPLIKRIIDFGKKVIIEINHPNQIMNIAHLSNITIVFAIEAEHVNLLRVNPLRIKVEDERNLIVFSNPAGRVTSLKSPVYLNDHKVDLDKEIEDGNENSM